MSFFASFKAWLHDHFGPEISDIETDLGKADEFLAEHAANVEALASGVVAALKAIAPAAGDEAAEALGVLEKAAADAQALYQKYFGSKGE